MRIFMGENSVSEILTIGDQPVHFPPFKEWGLGSFSKIVLWVRNSTEKNHRCLASRPFFPTLPNCHVYQSAQTRLCCRNKFRLAVAEHNNIVLLP